MREPKTKPKPTAVTVASHMAGIADPVRRGDCEQLIAMMTELTRVEPKMWGPTMVGFGDRHYRYASGRAGDTFVLGFASRKPDLVIYLSCETAAVSGDDLKRLGKCRASKACLYIRRLTDVDLAVLRELLARSAAG